MSSLRDPLYIPVMLPRARRTDSIRVSAVFHVSRCVLDFLVHMVYSKPGSLGCRYLSLGLATPLACGKTV